MAMAWLYFVVHGHGDGASHVVVDYQTKNKKPCRQNRKALTANEKADDGQTKDTYSVGDQ